MPSFLSICRRLGGELPEFLIIYMHTILKYIAFSLKFSSIRPSVAVPLSSGVLTAAEMQRLVADMVD